MAIANPYGADLGDRKPLEALAETPEKLRRLVAAWSDEDFEGTYAAGKWSFRKILVHLAQTELALTTRARFALSQTDYVSQAFSQDDWMAIDNRRRRARCPRYLHDGAPVQPCDVAGADARADRPRLQAS